ncbi:MAG: uracil-DNA glycosylase [Armatimonadota bacterium]|nr:uracil-DNA glycosylase [Armatimonadota bacterium]
MQGEGNWRTIEDVRAEAIVCCRCDLCFSRTHVVFGEGPPQSEMMIIGEGPGSEEDKQGKPFVGAAGRELNKVLSLAGLDREQIWITNIVRCRPATRENNMLRNRPPRMEEIKACDIWMSAEVRFISPKLIVCLGAVPAQALIGRGFKMEEGRGRWHQSKFSIPTTATYHPAYVLRLKAEDRERIESLMVADFKMAKSSF